MNDRHAGGSWFLSGLVALIAVGSAAAPRVLGADPLPRLSIDDARIREGDAGLTDLVFTIHLSPPSDSVVTVNLVTEDGTATVADSDYVAVGEQISFAPAETLLTVAVPIVGDTRLEGNEWLQARLVDPTGAELADSVAVGVILNDERTVFEPSAAEFTPYFGGTLPVAWGDLDDDGYPDLPLYRAGDQATFSEIPGFLELLADGNYHGGAWCDYDRDGDVDLVLLGYSGVEGGSETPTRLLRNDGAGVFTDVAPALGMDVRGAGETAVWGDFDGDGWPDLFAPYYSYIAPFQSFLYHNNGDSTFTDRAAEAGVALPGVPVERRPEGAAAADWNDDGHLDLYCASHLFLNDGTGVFSDVAAACGLPELFDEGASFVDFDNDGALDLYLRGEDGPHLFRNAGGQLIDVTAAAGLEPLPLAWGDSWADVDGDGDMDLLLTSGGGPARLMLNRGDGTFERDTTFDQLQVPSAPSAWADVDGNRAPDLVVVDGYSKRLYRNWLFRSAGFNPSRLDVLVLGSRGHHTACGATVRLRQLGAPPGFVQTAVVDGGSGYLSQNDYVVHFGGLGAGRYALEVVYPSPEGSRVVVDSLTNPGLGSLEPATMDHHTLTIYRDGRVETSGFEVGAVGRRLPGEDGRRLLGAPSPLPARSLVTLPVRLPRAGSVTLSVHDAGGRLVRRLSPGSLSAGEHTIAWDLRDGRGAAVATGVYFCRLMLDQVPRDARRVLVVR